MLDQWLKSLQKLLQPHWLKLLNQKYKNQRRKGQNPYFLANTVEKSLIGLDICKITKKLTLANYPTNVNNVIGSLQCYVIREDMWMKCTIMSKNMNVTNVAKRCPENITCKGIKKLWNILLEDVKHLVLRKTKSITTVLTCQWFPNLCQWFPNLCT